ncbi:LexA family transcriptional regulator [Methylobacterium sp. D54C]
MGICHIGDGQTSGQSPTMIADPVRRRLEAELEEQGRDMKEVSLAAGLGETYVRDALKRGRGKLENLFKVAAVLGKSNEWLIGVVESGPVEMRGSSTITMKPNASRREPVPSYGPPLDVLGVSRGGDDGKLVYNGQVIETIPRPPQLENVDEAYATYVVGDSMRPRFKPGEKVWVHPHRPPRQGDDVVVQLHPETEGEPPEGYIKEFVKITPNRLILSQHNPAHEIELDRRLVKSVHVIVGSLYV